METARIKTIEIQEKLNKMRKQADNDVQTRERLEREVQYQQGNKNENAVLLHTSQ